MRSVAVAAAADAAGVELADGVPPCAPRLRAPELRDLPLLHRLLLRGNQVRVQCAHPPHPPRRPLHAGKQALIKPLFRRRIQFSPQIFARHTRLAALSTQDAEEAAEAAELLDRATALSGPASYAYSSAACPSTPTGMSTPGGSTPGGSGQITPTTYGGGSGQITPNSNFGGQRTPLSAGQRTPSGGGSLA
eukprot:1120082-Prorocentrum_minimum.AAC.3